MKVLQLHNRYRVDGGEDISVEADRELLRQAGVEICLLEARNPSDPLRSAARLVRAPGNAASARRVRRVIERERPDIAHVHNTWFSLTPAAIEACKQSGLPVVMTLRNYRLICSKAVLFRDGHVCELCVEGSNLNGVRHRCYRDSVLQSAFAAATIARTTQQVVVENVDRFIALTEFSRSVHARGGIPRARTTVRSNFVEDPGPRRQPPAASERVLYVGRMTQEKGVEPLIDAWNAADTGPMKLTMIGYGDGLAETLGSRTGEDVEWLGRLSHAEVLELMRDSRALVFPSLWYEGQGRSMLESFACGLPVLAADVGSGRETVGELGERWLAAPGDVGDWKRKLESLATGDEAVNDAGARARALYERHYTPELARESLLRLYEDVLRAG